jgi:ABC-type transport system involved in multi-copper enzyme maturation permease subunit
MTFLPVVERELRVAGRNPAVYWTRSLTGLVAVIATAWILLFNATSPLRAMPNVQGQLVFNTVAALINIAVFFAGAVFTADAISSERREGTLGLLFLTDLRGFDVILGKLVAHSTSAIYSLLAVLPVLGIPLLLGGVTGAEYLRMVLAMLAMLMWSLCAGILVSTWNSESRTAASQTVGFLLGLAALFPLIGLIVAWLFSKAFNTDVLFEEFLQAIAVFSPPVASVFALDGAYRTPHGGWIYLASLSFSVVTSLLMLRWAGRRLARGWQDRALAHRKGGWTHRLETAGLERAGGEAALRARLLELSPIVWLNCRKRLRGLLIWAFLAMVAIAFLLTGAKVGRGWFDEAVFFGTSLFVHLILKVWLSGEAPRQFFEDRRTGGMELLLSTELTVSDFIAGQWRAIVRLFARPLTVVIGADLLIALFFMQSDSTSDDLPVWLWLARDGLLVVDAVALTLLGMWRGASTQKTRITGAAFFEVILLPWILIGLIVTAYGALRIAGVVEDLDFSLGLAVTAWTAIGIASAAFWSLHAWKRLNNQFREMATTRPGERRGGFWAPLWRGLGRLVGRTPAPESV